MELTCAVGGCDRNVRVRGLCQAHYDKARRRGDLKPLSIEDRFWAKVDKCGDDECWQWLATGTPKGYGQISIGGKYFYAHRFSYELHVGPIGEGLHIDHLCRNRGCVNPKHLEAVTPLVNWRRGEALSAIHARKTHCKHGHEFTPENTYRYTDKNGSKSRSCRTCYRLNAARREASRRAAK